MPQAYITIDDFKAGLDARRLSTASAPGSLQVFENANVNRGGEIVKAKKWVETFNLPSGTLGYNAINNTHFVFGSNAEPQGIPPGVEYQRLQHPDNLDMTEVLQSATFSGKIYVIARFTDGSVKHFFDGEEVTDWFVGKIRLAMSSFNDLTNEIKNDMAQDPDVDVTVSGDVLTATAKEDNTSFTFTTSTQDFGGTNDQEIVATTTQEAASDTKQITEFDFNGTFETGDEFTITINENVYGASAVTGETAATIQTHKDKMYAGFGTSVAASVIADPGLWRDNEQGSTANTGSGIIDISAQAVNDENVSAMAIYQGQLAIFTRNSTQLWSMDADFSANVQTQVLDNIGTRSPKTVKSFGDLDVFFLSESGFRSLRPRDSSNSASVSDVGTPIDDLVIEDLASLTQDQVENAAAVIDPQTGRYIASVGDKQYVFTFFETSDISSWSTYKPGVTFTDFGILNGRVYGRAGDKIYLLGGENNDVFVDGKVVVEIPYIDAQTLAHWKEWIGLDIIAEGTWDIFANTNPNKPDYWEKIATTVDGSIGELGYKVQQFKQMFKLRFEHQNGSEQAKLSRIAIHYNTTHAQ